MTRGARNPAERAPHGSIGSLLALGVVLAAVLWFTLRAPEKSVDAASGTVIVDVHREPVVAVDGVRVMVGGVSGVTDRRGKVALSVGVGTWLVTVDPTSLPELLLPPFAQDRLEPGPQPPGFHGRQVTVTAGGTVKVSLRVFAASSLLGRVVDRNGDPIAGCRVHLEGRSSRLAGVTASAVSGADGVYRLQDLRPGTYELLAWPAAPCASPVPLQREIAEGAFAAAPDLVIDGQANVASWGAESTGCVMPTTRNASPATSRPQRR